jgi:hypothetical protein
MSTQTQWKPCDCKARCEDKLADFYRADLAPGEVLAATITGYSYQVTETGLNEVPGLPFEIRYLATNRRTGAAQHKTKKGMFYASYCPYCGQPATQAVAEKAAGRTVESAKAERVA